MKGGGGAREGAGRPPKAPALIEAKGDEDSLEFLRLVMHDNSLDVKTRTRAAVALAQYEHTKRGDGGKKEEKGRAAKTAGEGKFKPAAPPKLVVVNNK